MYRNHRRGVHGANTQGLRHHTAREMDALGLLHVGSISLLEHDLGDPVIMGWLDGARAAGDDVHAFLRILPPGPFPDPISYGARVADVIRAHEHRFHGFVAANEQNIEWPGATVGAIARWNHDLWWQVRYYLGGRDDFPLFYPPAAPFAEISHLDVYRAGEADILERYRRLRWHEYPWVGDYGMVEEGFPPALYDAIAAGAVDSVIGEWGVNPYAGTEPGHGGWIEQYTDRFGSAAGGGGGRSVARHVTYWLLGSQDPAFERFALVGADGSHRQGLFDLAWFGP